jgi:hypothetical protein
MTASDNEYYGVCNPLSPIYLFVIIFGGILKLIEAN